MKVHTSHFVVLLASFKTATAFTGNFVISNITASTSNTSNSFTTVAFDFADQGTPDFTAHCSAEWSGATPSTGSHSCTNDTFTLKVLDENFKSVDDSIVTLSHTYYDNSVGDPPYNVLSKFANLTLNENTANYTCTDDKTSCHSTANLTVDITQIVS